MNLDLISRHLLGSMNVKKDILEDIDLLTNIQNAAILIAGRMKNRKKLMICGNGGSAADAQHIAAELTSILSMEVQRPGLAAIALTTDTSFLTANANDFGFEGIFERQVQALGNDLDVLLGISTSGNSMNVIRAFEYAHGHGMTAIALTGGTGGRIVDYAEITIMVPSNKVQHIQEAHITIGHIICELIEKELGYGV